MRPIDEFSYVKNNKILLDSDSLSQLYHPVIGNHAVLLYEYLLAFFDDGIKRHKFSEILNHLQLSMQEVEEALADFSGGHGGARARLGGPGWRAGGRMRRNRQGSKAREMEYHPLTP